MSNNEKKLSNLKLYTPGGGVVSFTTSYITLMHKTLMLKSYFLWDYIVVSRDRLLQDTLAVPLRTMVDAERENFPI